MKAGTPAPGRCNAPARQARSWTPSAASTRACSASKTAGAARGRMFDQHLLPLVRPRPSDAAGLVYAGGIDADGVILAGKVRSPASGETYEVKSGYLDLLENRVVADNVANLGNFLPGAGRAYEPLWRVHSLTLLTGEPFSMERELGIISELVGAERGGLYLDLGCSAGLYARGLARALGDRGDVVGIDISPSMLREAARALRETRRVLEPGGRLAVMGILRARTPRGRRLQRLLSTGGIRFFAPDQLGSMLHHAGFDPDPLRTHGAV